MKRLIFFVVMIALVVMAQQGPKNLTNLVTGVKGILQPGNGGTGSASAGSSGQVLRSNGTVFIASDDLRDLNWNLETPNPATDAGKFQSSVGMPMTAVELECNTDVDVASINIELRDANSPNNPTGVMLLGAPLSCGTTVDCSTGISCTQTFLAAGAIPAQTKLALVPVTAGGSVGLLRVHLEVKR